jgi:hypothetical protein
MHELRGCMNFVDAPDRLGGVTSHRATVPPWVTAVSRRPSGLNATAKTWPEPGPSVPNAAQRCPRPQPAPCRPYFPPPRVGRLGPTRPIIDASPPDRHSRWAPPAPSSVVLHPGGKQPGTPSKRVPGGPKPHKNPPAPPTNPGPADPPSPQPNPPPTDHPPPHHRWFPTRADTPDWPYPARHQCFSTRRTPPMAPPAPSSAVLQPGGKQPGTPSKRVPGGLKTL